VIGSLGHSAHDRAIKPVQSSTVPVNSVNLLAVADRSPDPGSHCSWQPATIDTEEMQVPAVRM
jgi:hypothetical protein